MPEQAEQASHIGVIAAVHGDSATVRFQRGSMCAHCGACLAVGEKEVEMRVPNTLHGSVGDRVRVNMESKRVTQASLLAYGIPLCLLLLGVWLGSFISEWAGLAFGVLGCLGAFLILRTLEKKKRFQGKFQPHMTELLPEGEEA